MLTAIQQVKADRGDMKDSKETIAELQQESAKAAEKERGKLGSGE